jgi:serine phosphatase RsbU (regulator of sigma subunit)
MSRRVQAVLVIGWFVAVLLLDESTHPSIVAGILYLFPVALTGWTWGWRWAAVMAVVAFFCQLHSDLSYQSQVTDWQPVAANEFLIGVMVVATTVVSARLAHQQRVITAMRDVMARELDQARALQEVLYRGVPRHPSLDLATWFQPAGSLGGDAIKATLEGDLLMVALADVSGKGAPAALAASVLIGLLADAPGRTSDPAQVLAYLNERLAGHLEGEKFVTLFYMVLNLSDGSLT